MRQPIIVELTAKNTASSRTIDILDEHGKKYIVLKAGACQGFKGLCLLLEPESDPHWAGWLPFSELDIREII